MTSLVLADAAFTIGQSHLDNAKPCQDYALAHSAESGRGVGWAAVSDGCSSAGLTDVGARMWVHAIKLLLSGCSTSFGTMFEDIELLRQTLVREGGALLAPFERLDSLATLLVACSDGRQARAVVFGDGVVAARTAEGVTTVWSVEYERNAPRYLGYEVPRGDGTDDLPRWHALVADSRVFVRIETFSALGEPLSSATEQHLATAFPGLLLSWDNVDCLQALLVATDGVSSFDKQPAAYGVEQLLAVKNPTGQYFHRRLGAMARSWKKGASPMPQDDLGAGLLWLTPREVSDE